MLNLAFTRSSTPKIALFAFFIATFCVLNVFSQNGGVSKDSKPSIKSKEYEAKERRESELRNRKSYSPAANRKAQRGPTVKPEMRYYGESEPLSELAKKQSPISKENGMLQEDQMEPLFEVPETTSKKRQISVPAFVQTDNFVPSVLTLGANFEGPGTGLAGFSLTGAPPDMTMAVGPNHVVAMVNSQYAVFNKTGTVLLGPVNGNALFTGVGGNCETTNRGDPILQYDRMADRWILSQFAFTSGASAQPPYLQCIAVSTTGNPTGTYVRYVVTFDPTTPGGFNDYGKLGVWPDAYYTAYNIFNNGTTGTGAGLCASNRVKMLAGDPTATTLCAPIANYAGGGSFIPADFEGTTAPTNSSQGGIFIRQSTAPAFRLIKLKADFTAGTVTLTDGLGGAAGSFVNIPIVLTRACNGAGGACIAQPGTTTLLDTLGDRMMYRLSYRNIGGVDRLVGSMSEDPDGAGARSAAIRWFEIRNPFSAAPTLFQNATYDPGAAGDRWMSSMATNKCGDIGMSYSVVNTATPLKASIGLTGRLSIDAANTMQAETITTTGTGSQTVNGAGTALTRWGDYSTMQVDPSDDITFWYISQYLAADGAFNWRTRIASAKFSTCLATAAGVEISGRVLSSAAGRGLRNATVTLTDQKGNVRTALASPYGQYRFDDVESGQTYIISVRSRRFTFAPRVLQITDSISNVDFVPEQ